MKPQRIQNLVELHLAALLFGFIGLTVQAIETDVLTIAMGRSVFAAAFLLVAIFLSKSALRLRGKKDYFFLFLLGFLQAMQWLTFFKSVKVSTVAIGLLSLYTFPAFVTFLEPIFFKEKLRFSQLVSSLLIFAAITLVAGKVDLGHANTIGVLWGLLSAFSMALTFLLHRIYIQTYSSLTISFYKTAVTALVILPFTSFLEANLQAQNLLLLALLGIAFTAVPYYLMIKSLQTIKAQQVSSIISLEVAYGIIFSIFLISEYPTIQTIIGGVILFSVAVYLSRQIKNEP